MVATLVLLSARTALGDYELRPAEDNPAPLIDALARGDWSQAREVIPAMGLVSIVLRVPAAMLGGGDLEWVYALGALLCLLPCLVLAALVDRRLTEDGRPLLFRLVTGLALVAGPAVVFSLDSGHPEEILGGTLCIAAVLAAERQRALAAAVLLGLAVGTKQWAIIATFPVLLALGSGRAPLITRTRIQAALASAAVALACIGPVIAMNPSRYESVSRSLASAQRAYPQTLLWPVSPERTREIALGGGEVERLTTWEAPFGISRAPATAITLLLALALVPLILRSGGLPSQSPRKSARGSAPAPDALGLLVALLALRCLLDPMNLDYYAAPALAALAVWEARSPHERSLPLLTIAASAAALVAWRVIGDTAPAVEWAVWLAATAPLLLLAAPALQRKTPPTTEVAEGV